MSNRYVNTVTPYSYTLFQSGVFSVGAMHGLSSGQAHILALLTAAAGIPLAAVIWFSRSKISRSAGIKKGQEVFTAYPIARRKI